MWDCLQVSISSSNSVHAVDIKSFVSEYPYLLSTYIVKYII